MAGVGFVGSLLVAFGVLLVMIGVVTARAAMTAGNTPSRINPGLGTITGGAVLVVVGLVVASLSILLG